ncbi:ClpXP protease specificity-enhancing factor [Shewanella surugensis]|uniref:ClpXP protease specificity-enhancing factor n=1 Tax=Shewanella surugensis TaxID=212020 RepID=A0ABT0LEM3_9GAMM|nr:ClpXP protease specificity-enhancing factor [Shewanella surugensis]MCL1126157.1 ClpXP protease specificity-enhancing factor [Shewanella surugensis]
MKELSPNRPYLLRAYYEWLMDNELTPHVVIDAYVPNTMVPQQYVKDGQIVLNIASSAVSELVISNESIEFSARFGGVLQQLFLPMASVIAIYARENGAGTVFDLEEAYQMTDEPEEQGLAIVEESLETTKNVTKSVTKRDKADSSKRRSHLTLVK